MCRNLYKPTIGYNATPKGEIMGLERVVGDLQRRGFSPVPFPLTREQLERAANAFLDFIALPLDTKTRFTGMAFPGDRGSVVGYAKKQKAADVRDDNKEYVHYNEHFERFFVALLGTHPVIDAFVAEARIVYDAAKDTLGHILDALEEYRPGIKQEFMTPGTLPRFYLRFIKYDHVGRDGTIAKGHYDRGALTLAIAESAPGLRIGTEESLTEIVHQEQQAVLFPGEAIEKVFDSTVIKPAWHDAIQKDDKQVRPGVARWAIVFFGDLLNQPEYSWEQAHTPKREY